MNWHCFLSVVQLETSSSRRSGCGWIVDVLWNSQGSWQVTPNSSLLCLTFNLWIIPHCGHAFVPLWDVIIKGFLPSRRCTGVEYDCFPHFDGLWITWVNLLVQHHLIITLPPWALKGVKNVSLEASHLAANTKCIWGGCELMLDEPTLPPTSKWITWWVALCFVWGLTWVAISQFRSWISVWLVPLSDSQGRKVGHTLHLAAKLGVCCK